MNAAMIPSAARLMTSLRDIGYDAEAAIADLVDNSIDAGARHIRVDLVHDAESAFVTIADDGTGMTEREIDEAMRYGSSRPYGDRDLGRYGLGLKTASLSQCRCLTVASRSTAKGQIRIRRWDLDRVVETDEWLLERPLVREVPAELVDPLRETSGTVVMWEDLDRVLGYADPGGHHARAFMATLAKSVAAHLSMVFHRFLAGEGRRRVRIEVNGTLLKAWDPYARSEQLVQALSPQRLSFTHHGRTHKVTIRPFVLPAQHHFSSPAAHELAGGPRRWNRQQGLYIYRRGRLIQAGGWNRLRTLDEHSKLARVAVEIPAGAEEAFRVDVGKTTVSIPNELRGHLRTVLAGVVAVAQDVYRQRVRLVPSANADAPTVTPLTEAASNARQMGDIWKVVESTLRRELEDDPVTLDRLLLALANEPPLAAEG